MHRFVPGEGQGKVTLSLCLLVGRCTPALLVNQECMKFQRFLAAPDPAFSVFLICFRQIPSDPLFAGKSPQSCAGWREAGR